MPRLAGVDGDGAALIGQALGGDNPRIKINSLQSDTERNVQRANEQILRGMYQAVRNPRSHDAEWKAFVDASSAAIKVFQVRGRLREDAQIGRDA